MNVVHVSFPGNHHLRRRGFAKFPLPSMVLSQTRWQIMAKSNSIPVENRLLQSLPDKDWQKLQPAFQPFTMEFKKTLFERSAPMNYAYFPNTGMISVVIFMED